MKMIIDDIINEICKKRHCYNCEMEMYPGCMCAKPDLYRDKIIDYFIRLFPDKVDLIDKSLLPCNIDMTEEELMSVFSD